MSLQEQKHSCFGVSYFWRELSSFKNKNFTHHRRLNCVISRLSLRLIQTKLTFTRLRGTNCDWSFTSDKTCREARKITWPTRWLERNIFSDVSSATEHKMGKHLRQSQFRTKHKEKSNALLINKEGDPKRRCSQTSNRWRNTKPSTYQSRRKSKHSISVIRGEANIYIFFKLTLNFFNITSWSFRQTQMMRNIHWRCGRCHWLQSCQMLTSGGQWMGRSLRRLSSYGL